MTTIYLLTSPDVDDLSPGAFTVDGAFSTAELAEQHVAAWPNKGLYGDGSKRYSITPMTLDVPE